MWIQEKDPKTTGYEILAEIRKLEYKLGKLSSIRNS